MQQVIQHHHLEDEVITALDRVVVDLSKAKLSKKKSGTPAPPIKRERAASDGDKHRGKLQAKKRAAPTPPTGSTSKKAVSIAGRLCVSFATLTYGLTRR